MAWEQEDFCPVGLAAGADLSSYQYYWVKISGNNEVNICSAVSDVPCGILQNKPTSGQATKVMASGVSKMKVGSLCTAGNLVGTDVSGKGEPKTVGSDTTHYVCGQVIEGAAADELATVMIDCKAPHRAS